MIERIINSVLRNRGLVLVALLGVIGLGVLWAGVLHSIVLGR